MKLWYEKINELLKSSMVWSHAFHSRFYEDWKAVSGGHEYVVRKYTDYKEVSFCDFNDQVINVAIIIVVKNVNELSDEFWYSFTSSEPDLEFKNHPSWLIELFQRAEVLEDGYVV